MNPIRRSALALAATCGAVALTSAVDAAPSTVSPTVSPDGGTPVPVDPAAPGDACVDPTATTEPVVTEPVQAFGPDSTTTTTTTVPEPTTTTTIPATTIPATTTPASTTPAPVDTTTTVPETCEPPVPTTSIVPSPAPPSPEPPPAVPPEETASVPPEAAPPAESVNGPVEAATPAVALPPAESAVEGVDPTLAGSPAPVEDAAAPLPADNATWASDGSIRLRSPRDPGASLLQPGRTPAVDRSVFVDDVELILTTIRQMESGGRYEVGPNRALASGAYQYIPSTWNNYGGYAHAFLAPAEVQDERARADVIRFLTMYDGDVSMVPVMWYYPRAAVDASWMDRVPSPGSGNRLTIREYQTRWLDRLASNASTLLGTYVPAPSTPAAVSVVSELPGAEPAVDPPPVDPVAVAPPAVEPVAVGPVATEPVATVAPPPAADPAVAPSPAPAPPVVLDEVTVGEDTVELAARSLPPDYDEDGHGAGAMRSIVFPVLGPATYADGWGDERDGGLRSHEGTDIIGVQMQPILAAVDGVVSRYQPSSNGIRGVAVTITDADGWRYNYFHNNDDSPGTDDGQAADAFRLAPGVQFGDDVVAGQIIGYLGDSGNAEQSVIHLHFELRDPTGAARPSYWSLRAAEARQACSIGIGAWSTPSLADPLPIDPDAIVPAAVDPAAVDPAAVDPAAPAPPVAEHTVVTPLFGEGQWIIDSAGRVTATGDAALIMPRRELECDPGPAVPFGTDGAGWGGLGSDVLEGTVLAGIDLTGTVLDGLIPAPAVDPAPAVPAAAVPAAVDPAAAPPTVDAAAPIVDPATEPPPSPSEPVVPVDAGATGADDPIAQPMVFTDPASGETIIVVFEMPVARPEAPMMTGLR